MHSDRCDTTMNVDVGNMTIAAIRMVWNGMNRMMTHDGSVETMTATVTAAITATVGDDSVHQSKSNKNDCKNLFQENKKL